MAYYVTINCDAVGRERRGPFGDLDAARFIYEKTRDDSYEGASTFMPGQVDEDGKNVGYFSYNGKFWTKD